MPTNLREVCPRLKVLIADVACGQMELPESVRKTFGRDLQGGGWRPVGIKKLIVLPRRWIVERTVAWRGRHK